MSKAIQQHSKLFLFRGFRELLIAVFIFGAVSNLVFAQTAKVYRGTTLIGTYTTLAAASAAANTIGDSILLSAHTFKEHDLNMYGGQIWQGTITATDTSTIDAEHLGRIARFNLKSKKSLVLRDIICINGEAVTNGAISGGASGGGDSIKLMGRTIIRNCHASSSSGVATNLHLYNNVKIIGNSADVCGGVGALIIAFDSVEICYNYSSIGGVAASDTVLIGYSGGGSLLAYSPGIKIMHNSATLAGGVVSGSIRLYGCQALFNNAPIGALAYLKNGGLLKDAYVYNPGAGTTRQNEIFINDGFPLNLDGAWFGDSDTTGLILKKSASSTINIGKYAIANWSINRGKAITKSDTTFPLQAAFTYQDGSAVPANSYPWLAGNFNVDKGSFDTPKPKMSPTDTIGSIYRTYAHSFGDTGSKPVNFVCNVDLDTFRATRLVWGKPNLSINDKSREIQVMVYPNPAQEVLNIQGVESGSIIELYDVMGKIVLQKLCDSSLAKLDVEHLSKGTYTLKITTKEGNEGSAKVMKE